MFGSNGHQRRSEEDKWKEMEKTVNLIQEKKLQKYIDEKSQTYNHLIISDNSTQKPAMTAKKKKYTNTQQSYSKQTWFSEND